MKYTFTDEQGKQQTVEIPEEIIRKHKRNLGLTTSGAIKLFLSDEGYISDAVVEELTAKAKEGNDTAKTRKPRKPDYTKRAIIQEVVEALKGLGMETEDGIKIIADNVEATNIERIVAFTIGCDKYELTLSKKRKSK